MKLIKITSLLNFLFTLLTMVATDLLALKESRRRFIVVHPDSIHPFNHNIDVVEANISLLMHEDKLNFVAADLTDKEIKYLKNIVINHKGLIVENNLIFLDDTVSIGSYLNAQNVVSSADKFLTNTPKCTTPLNNVDFIVVDTLVYKNISEFSNVKISYGPIFTTNKQPCHPHATEITSILVGDNSGVIPQGNRTIYNVAVFDCLGRGFPEQIIKGFNASIQFAKSSAANGRRAIINFSGIGGINPAINLAATAIVNVGIPLFIPAGNSGVNACKLRSPAGAKKVFTVGATQFPGNIPANFTNFGNKCVKLFLPGVGVTVVNWITNGTTKVDGTSFGAPIAAALGGLELGLDPKATPKQMFDRLTARTRTEMVIPPPGSNFLSPMKVLLTANACPADTRLFNSLVIRKSQNNKFDKWYNVAEFGDLCVSFDAIIERGKGLLLALRNNVTDENYIKIKIYSIQDNDVSSLSQFDVILDKSIKKNVFIQKIGTTFTIKSANDSMIVEYDTPAGIKKPLLFAKVKENKQQIAFSGLDAVVKYSHATKCLV